MNAKRCKNCGKLLSKVNINGFCSPECKRDYQELMEWALDKAAMEFSQAFSL